MPQPNPIVLVTTVSASDTVIVTGRLRPITLRWRGADALDTLIVKDGADVVILTAIAPAIPATDSSQEFTMLDKTDAITGLKVSTLGGGAVDLYYKR